MEKSDNYKGFELGPIRPPSEAKSLLLRITRNCPWNNCKFCHLYKGEKFSIRPVEHIKKEIDLIKKYIDLLSQNNHSHALMESIPRDEKTAFQVALSWKRNRMKSIFLQDANTMIVKPSDLIDILNYIKGKFPGTESITSYARSQTISKISDADLSSIAKAGLNRIHIGMESACDEVLEFIKKGVDKKTHIIAGQKVKNAGIQLSIYYMPGLGGKKLLEKNALETADAINQIDPDFLRIRTLAIPKTTKLYNDYQSGKFEYPGDIALAKELLLLLENLEGIKTRVLSDHIINLFQDVQGRLPHDKEKIIAPIKKFFKMDAKDKTTYMLGRRAGIFNSVNDMENKELLGYALRAKQAHNITNENIEEFTFKTIQRYI